MQIKERTEMGEEEHVTKQGESTFSVEKIEGFPEWITMRSDGRYIVKDRTGKEYVFEDIPNSKIAAATRRVTQGRTDPDMEKVQLALVSAAMMEPKMGEMEVDALPGSIAFRLKAAVMKIFDLDSFL